MLDSVRQFLTKVVSTAPFRPKGIQSEMVASWQHQLPKNNHCAEEKIEDILAENIIGRKVPCNTLVEHICRNFACISHPTHSLKKLAPFYLYSLEV